MLSFTGQERALSSEACRAVSHTAARVSGRATDRNGANQVIVLRRCEPGRVGGNGPVARLPWATRAVPRIAARVSERHVPSPRREPWGARREAAHSPGRGDTVRAPSEVVPQHIPAGRAKPPTRIGSPCRAYGINRQRFSILKPCVQQRALWRESRVAPGGAGARCAALTHGLRRGLDGVAPDGAFLPRNLPIHGSRQWRGLDGVAPGGVGARCAAELRPPTCSPLPVPCFPLASASDQSILPEPRHELS